jgi:hypothetical protein
VRGEVLFLRVLHLLVRRVRQLVLPRMRVVQGQLKKRVVVRDAPGATTLHATVSSSACRECARARLT